MKRNWRNNGAIYFLAALLILASCGQGNHAEHEDTYTCPMHPTVISDRPGACPVCGMDLVRKARAGEEVEITEDLAKLIKSPNETVVASVKTIKGIYRSVPLSIEAQGVVTYDTRNIYTIPSRVGGRIEKIHLKYAYQPVRKGQKIAAIYSPELITAQRELLFLLEHDASNRPLIDAAKSRLQLLGLTDPQISDLIRSKVTHNTFSLYSPYSGYLITDEPAPSTSTTVQATQGAAPAGMRDGMGRMPSGPAPATAAQNPAGTILREGDYVSAGQTLFRIVNTNTLRIELDLPAKESGTIREGDRLELDLGNNEKAPATVDLVQPFFNAGEDFVKLRVLTKETGNLHIGHLVTAKIQLASAESLWVPQASVLDLGTEKVVFIKDKGVLKPKKVIAGATSEGFIQIRSGLASSDEIAANAQYLIDSESFVKTTK